LRALSRGSLVAVLSVLATLLVPTGSAAAADNVYALYTPGASDVPQYLRPLVQTAAGLVYENTYESTTWVDPAGTAAASREDRLPDPVVIGDLLSSYDSASRTLRWRTIADPTLEETVLPADVEYLTRTATGYLGRQGDGPYDLVVVDLLGGGTSDLIGTMAQTEGAIAGPLGAAVPSSGSDEWRYYPYDGSNPGGQPIHAPVDSPDCRLASEFLFCWSATTLTRLPLNGDPGATAGGSPISLIETTDGVAYTTPHVRYRDTWWHQVWVWRSTDAGPAVAVNSDRKLTGHLAPVSDGTSLALADREGDPWESGIYRISSTYSVTRSFGSTARQPRTATAIAVGPGRVAWSDNSSISGVVLERPWTVQPDGGLALATTIPTDYGTYGAALSVSGNRVAYGTNDGARSLQLFGYGGSQLNTGEAVRSAVSGWRLIWQSRGANGGLSWHMRDLTRINGVNAPVTSLPDAIAYDLWGERMVRLDADGSVWAYDLRTAAPPVQMAPSFPGGAVGGTVRVAGDLVAWDVEPAAPGEPDPGVNVRNIASMDPSAPVIGLSELQDLSTGYAVGHGCDDDDTCSPRAIGLTDGSVFPVETDRPMAVDGNILAFISTAGIPSVRTLPAYADSPRLLATLNATTAVRFEWSQKFEMRVEVSQPLTTCAVEFRNSDDELVHTEPCIYSGRDGHAAMRWGGGTPTMNRVPDGIYSWRLVAANGTGQIEEYDGSTADFTGTLEVGPPPPVGVPMPDLGFAHRRSDGGINLFRLDLYEAEGEILGTAFPQPVRALPASSGFRMDRSTVVAGDFGDLTPGDNGTADHVVWHAGSDGGVRVWTVAGSSDTTPRQQHVLPRSAGWSWADSRPLAGDLNGDGWDDLLVVHRGRSGNAVWAFLSDGTRLGAPQRWGTIPGDFGTMRNYVADADGDWNEDLITTSPASGSFRTTTLLTRPDGTAALPAVDSHAATFRTVDGWSLAYSRQLAGDVTSDGLVDLVTVHRSGSGGIVVWVSASCSATEGDVCWEAPVKWQTLSTGWSFANSRQYLADHDGDYVDDLVTVHRSSVGGIFVWRHLSDYTELRAPQKTLALATTAGWNWSQSRESVANTWGWIAAEGATAGGVAQRGQPGAS
jgi:hypothetical protein